MSILLAAAWPLPAAAVDVSEEILANGIEAYHSGKLEPAIGGISAALRGRLPAAQVAKAHYYRGLAYRKQGNPGRAISDFTTALEYPGLTENERSDAIENRVAAYQEAGIADSELVVVAARKEASESRSKPAPPPAPAKAPPPSQSPRIVTTASTGAPPAAAEPPVVPTAGWSNSAQVAIAAPLPAAATTPSTAPRPPSSDKVEMAPLPPAAAPKPQPRSAASGWTGTALITTATTIPAAAQAPLPAPAAWTAPVEASPLPPVPAAKPPARSAASSWSTTAFAAPVQSPPASPPPPFVTQVAAVMPSTPPTATSLPPVIGETRLFVGEARSRSEAFALAIRLTSQRGAEIGPRKPQIAEGTINGAGPFYRVRLGPYSDASRALALCRSLRESGYDCVAE